MGGGLAGGIWVDTSGPLVGRIPSWAGKQYTCTCPCPCSCPCPSGSACASSGGGGLTE